MASLLGGRRVLVIPLDSSGTVTSAAPSMGLDGLIPPFHADAFRPKIQTSRARFPYGAIAITIIIVIVINRQENGELICLCRLMTFHDGRRCQSRQPTLCWPILFFWGVGGRWKKKRKIKHGNRKLGAVTSQSRGRTSSGYLRTVGNGPVNFCFYLFFLRRKWGEMGKKNKRKWDFFFSLSRTVLKQCIRK